MTLSTEQRVRFVAKWCVRGPELGGDGEYRTRTETTLIRAKRVAQRQADKVGDSWARVIERVESRWGWLDGRIWLMHPGHEWEELDD